MNRPSGMRSVLTASLFVSLVFGCGDDPEFSPEKDREALERIENTWTAEFDGKEFTVSICEDTRRNQASAGWEAGCAYDRIVRSIDPAPRRHPDRSGCGGGGCEFKVVTWVRAAVTDADGNTVYMTGDVLLGDSYGSDPYGNTYRVFLSSLEDGRSRLDFKLTKARIGLPTAESLRSLGFRAYERDEDDYYLIPSGVPVCPLADFPEPEIETPPEYGTDAGAPEDDAGLSRDGGTTDTDADIPGEDAGTGDADAGTGSEDAGEPEDDAGDSDADLPADDGDADVDEDSGEPGEADGAGDSEDPDAADDSETPGEPEESEG